MITLSNLVYSGCWNCGELRTKLKSVQNNQHRHCPKCDYIMDYEYKGWGYGKYFFLQYVCKKCDFKVRCDNQGTRDGLNNAYGYGWSIDSVITKGFLKAQKERIGYKYLDDQDDEDEDQKEIKSEIQNDFKIVNTDGSVQKVVN